VVVQNLPGKTIILVGQPNVGKSAVMNNLTGAGVMVSNYPGTTVEVTKGYLHYKGKSWRLIDTPGIYTLHSDTEEQQVTQRILLEGNIDAIINVVDATNLDRNLYLTIQLLDFDIPLVLVLNQMDRARKKGLRIDVQLLENILGVPVIPAAAAQREGMEEIKERIEMAARGNPMRFSGQVEKDIDQLGTILNEVIAGEEKKHGHSLRTLAIHLLEHDRMDEPLISMYPDLQKYIEDLQKGMNEKHPACPSCFRGCAFCPAFDRQHPVFLTCLERTAKAREIAGEVAKADEHRQKTTWPERIEEFIDRPATGIPVLLAAVYLSFKLIIQAIEVSEEGISFLLIYFGKWFTGWFGPPPQGFFWDVLAKSFSEGLIIPFSVVMPAMISVYLLIALLEDTGFLPRLAVVLDRLTRIISLPGQSFIPLVLGFGCRAPAVLATRILPERRERFVVTVLLSIVVPCAASLGIITAVVAKLGAALPVILLTMLVVFLLLSILLGRALPGEKMGLIMEVPPLRAPIPRYVFLKTWARMEGFFTQVLPLMLVMSLAVRILLAIGAFQLLGSIDSLTKFFWGIPGEAFIGVAVTVVQRYLAPMVLLNLPLNAREATIACTMVALSFPCLPVSVLIWKELGRRDFFKILALAAFIPILAGAVLNIILPA